MKIDLHSPEVQEHIKLQTKEAIDIMKELGKPEFNENTLKLIEEHSHFALTHMIELKMKRVIIHNMTNPDNQLNVVQEVYKEFFI